MRKIFEKVLKWILSIDNNEDRLVVNFNILTTNMTAWYTKKDDGILYRKCASGRIFVPE